MSGVLATVTAGLIIGNLDLLSVNEKGYLSLKGREFVISFWEFAAFLANSVVFLLIGIDVAAVPFDLWITGSSGFDRTRASWSGVSRLPAQLALSSFSMGDFAS